MTALLVACELGRTAVALALIRKGATLSAVDKVILGRLLPKGDRGRGGAGADIVNSCK